MCQILSDRIGCCLFWQSLVRANMDGEQISRLPRQVSLGVNNLHQSCWSPFSPFLPVMVLTLMTAWPSGSEWKVPGRGITSILQTGISWAMMAWITGGLATLALNSCFHKPFPCLCPGSDVTPSCCAGFAVSFQGKLGALSRVRKSSGQLSWHKNRDRIQLWFLNLNITK